MGFAWGSPVELQLGVPTVLSLERMLKSRNVNDKSRYRVSLNVWESAASLFCLCSFHQSQELSSCACSQQTYSSRDQALVLRCSLHSEASCEKPDLAMFFFQILLLLLGQINLKVEGDSGLWKVRNLYVVNHWGHVQPPKSCLAHWVPQ